MCQGWHKFVKTEKFVACGTMVKFGEDSLCQGMLVNTKTWTCYWKSVFASMFWQ